MKKLFFNSQKRVFSTSFKVTLQKQSYVPRHPVVDEKDINTLSNFVNTHEKIFVLTGAGISTESGIRDYRSEGVGLYATSSSRPTQYRDFLNNPTMRHRYWARSFEGWPSFSSYKPNICHQIVADMEHYGNLYWLVTQNVDDLHKKAGSHRITELHGTQFRVGCLSCKYEECRHKIQDVLNQLNQDWVRSHLIVQGPDGDAMIDEHLTQNFKMIDCPSCGGILKPKVVFFGDNVSSEIKNFLVEKLKESNALLIIGSSLQVYSSFRFVLKAKEENIPIVIVNIGETRGDTHASIKISAKAGDILPRLKLKWKKDILLKTEF